MSNTHCEECGGSLVKGRGFMVCKECGLEQSQIFSQGRVRRINREDYVDLNTTPVGIVSFHKLTSFTPRTRQDYRLKTQDNIEVAKDSSDLAIIGYIRNIVSLLKRPKSFFDQCCYIERKLRKYMKNFSGRSLEDTACCIVYLTALIHEVDITVDDIIDVRIMSEDRDNENTINYFLNRCYNIDYFKRLLR